MVINRIFRKTTSIYRKLYLIYRKRISLLYALIGLTSNKNAPTHPIISKHNIGKLEIIEIEREVKININNRKDNGYHNYSNAWWYNINCPYSFSYIDIDSLYPNQYFFSENTGHPNKKYAEELYNYMQEVYSLYFDRKFSSILELETGGGEITYQFHKNNLDYIAVEGSIEGCNKLISIGISSDRIINANLKKMKPLNRVFDLVMCTEVIEHIEPFFASKIIELCTSHSKAVWFSATDRIGPAHYHHCNEISIYAWDNIFAYFGFNLYIPLNKLHYRADRMYISNL